MQIRKVRRPYLHICSVKKSQKVSTSKRKLGFEGDLRNARLQIFSHGNWHDADNIQLPKFVFILASYNLELTLGEGEAVLLTN